MTKTKQIVISQLKPVFKQYGYKLKPGHYTSFIKTDSEHIYSVGFSMGTKLQIMHGGNMSIADLRIERIILEIGFPNIDLTTYRQGKDQLFTVADKSEKALSMGGIRLATEEDALKFVRNVIAYLNQQGWAFSQHYSHLSNVLSQMDQLIGEGKYWHSILEGRGEHLFRGLIISKLCNDPLFDDKLQYVGDLLFGKDNKMQDWLPYYQHLKIKLASLQPLTVV